MDEEFLLAVNGEWDALLAALRLNRMLAHHVDANGMTLLHWVCLHHNIPTEVLIKIVFANPHAVHMRNEAGHVPIDLAVQAECEERILEVLRAADSTRHGGEPEPSPLPQSTPQDQDRRGLPYSPTSRSQATSTNTYGQQYAEEDLTFDHPRYFHPQDRRVGSTRSPAHSDQPSLEQFALTTRKQLHSVYSGSQRGAHPHSKSMSFADDRLVQHRHNHDALSVSEFPSYGVDSTSDSQLMQAPRTEKKWRTKAATVKSSFPPRWKQARSCYVCTLPFSMMKRRHHCRNCGHSVCSQHSTNRVALPKFNLIDPQRVCDQCFLAGRHLSVSAAAPSSTSQQDNYRTNSYSNRQQV
ncbi:hypothetical protein P43SY_008951 [Pythium insidiosum]|uniref:FYVE-type domain-containing protein n=1 Tax=Pythium insidiosum TaxID=114742 RepID=A0AAD5M8I7_PYTIN|nr:hypothetical protein P43SY_008951 [Pythium insidiosum]